jgi:hypothetical protein
VIDAADGCDATLVGRAALGTSFVEVAPDAAGPLRRALPASARAVVLDAPAPLRAAGESWGAQAGPELELMRRIKMRFDPSDTCNRGLFVGGI